jgi:hypothetical protein
MQNQWLSKILNSIFSSKSFETPPPPIQYTDLSIGLASKRAAPDKGQRTKQRPTARYSESVIERAGEPSTDLLAWVGEIFGSRNIRTHFRTMAQNQAVSTHYDYKIYSNYLGRASGNEMHLA